MTGVENTLPPLDASTTGGSSMVVQLARCLSRILNKPLTLVESVIKSLLIYTAGKFRGYFRMNCQKTLGKDTDFTRNKKIC